MDFYTEDEFLMLSGIQHFAFCPRQWGLIHIEQQWIDNILTFRGGELHQKANDPLSTEKRGDVIVTRAVPITSKSLGVNGVADVIEFHRVDDGQGIKLSGRRGWWKPIPVEYKLGAPKPTNCDKLQLCAQAICLEETFNVELSQAFIFYGRTKRRLDVDLNRELKEETYDIARQMHHAFSKGKIPDPVITKGCEKCSLVDICLPDLFHRRSVKSYLQSVLKDN